LRLAGLAVVDYVYTSTNRRLADICDGTGFLVEHDVPVSTGRYRHVVLRKS
jgi:hypothetical protein